MGNNDLQEIKKDINSLNKYLQESIEKKIDQIVKNESEILNQIKKIIEKQNEERNKLNRLIVKFFIPIASGLMFLLVFIYSLRDKSIESVLLSLSILGIGAVSVIGLVVALAIINKRED